MRVTTSDKKTQIEAAAEWVTPDKIRGWPKNPRNFDQIVRKLARSIRRFGFGAPIVARKADGEVIAGHARLMAAKRLNLPLVPVRFLDISVEDAHALAVIDNKLGEGAEWRDDLLDDVVRQMSEDDLEIAGFSDDQIDQALGIEVEKSSKSEVARGESRGFNYKLLVTCENEDQQALLMEELENRGHICKPVIA